MKEIINKLFEEISGGNNYGEKVTLVGATKFVPVERINEAISLGLTDIGENKAQEFRDKFPSVLPCNYHFFGRLQKNKVKYLVGKACLIQSVDSIDLASEISKKSVELGVTSKILLEVNQGEEQKGGFSYSDLDNALKTISQMPNIVIEGLMSVMMDTDDEIALANAYKELRKIYDKYKDIYSFKYLSAGMSGDYKIAIKNGANMIRIGTMIFGKRDYNI